MNIKLRNKSIEILYIHGKQDFHKTFVFRNETGP